MDNNSISKTASDPIMDELLASFPSLTISSNQAEQQQPEQEEESEEELLDDLIGLPINQALLSDIIITIISTDFNPKFGSWTSNPCAICTEDYLPGQPVKELPCGHYYHSRCFVQSFIGATQCLSCPECRTPLFSAWKGRAAEIEREVAARGDDFGESMLVVLLTLAIEAPTPMCRAELIDLAAELVDQAHLAGVHSRTGEDLWEPTVRIVLQSISTHINPKGAPAKSPGKRLSEDKAGVLAGRAVGSVHDPADEEYCAWRHEYLAETLLLCDYYRHMDDWEEVEEEA